MEKTIKTMLALMAGALTFSACSSEDTTNNGNSNSNNGATLTTLTAYQEGDATSRAAIGTTTGTSTTINWKSGDAIGVFASTGTSTQYTTTTNDVTSASFTGTAVSGAAYALYPYQSAATVASDAISGVVIPTTQTATVGSFDPAAAIMVGTVSGSSITFKNVCSFLKFTTAQDYTKVVVSVTSGNIAGTFTVTPSTGAVTATSGGQSITLNPASGSAKIAAGVYYVAIAPGTNMSGFKLECYTDASTHVDRSQTVESTFDRNKVYKLGVTEAITGTAKATINSSDVDVEWVQLWAGGPKFARRNVGATGSSDKESTKGTTMAYTDAAKTGTEYVWGANWKTATKDEMDLIGSTYSPGGNGRVKYEYTTQDGVYGFKFTGVQDGYTSSSLFLPADDSSSETTGNVRYWSSTAKGQNAYDLSLSYTSFDGYSCNWYTNTQNYNVYVRPVLR